MGGSLWQYRDRYIANSPLFAFDKIQTPLLIGQGERDGDLVPSDAIFAALQATRKAGGVSDCLEGEGHVITPRAERHGLLEAPIEFFLGIWTLPST